MCSYLKISPELRRQLQKHKTFLPSLPSACLFASLSFLGKADGDDLELDVNALLKLMDSNSVISRVLSFVFASAVTPS